MRASTIPWPGRRRGAGGLEDERRMAEAIYGVIVSAAVMAASHPLGSGRLAIAVLVTLFVYWAAERYAAVMAGRIVAGHKRSRATVRQELTHGWELVTASFLPILVLLAVDLLGADLTTSVLAGLICSTLLLFLAGLQIGADGRLSGMARVGSGIAASAFGLVMIALKVALH
jgi:hypothetical protein